MCLLTTLGRILRAMSQYIWIHMIFSHCTYIRMFTNIQHNNDLDVVRRPRSTARGKASERDGNIGECETPRGVYRGVFEARHCFLISTMQQWIWNILSTVLVFDSTVFSYIIISFDPFARSLDSKITVFEALLRVVHARGWHHVSVGINHREKAATISADVRAGHLVSPNNRAIWRKRTFKMGPNRDSSCKG